MTDLILGSLPLPPPAILPPGLQVRIDDLPRRDLCVLCVRLAPGPEFGLARIEAVGGNGLRPERRLGEPAVLPALGSRLTIREPESGAIVFEGVVTRHISGAAPDAESLVAEADDLLAVRLAGPLIGRWHQRDESAVFVPTGRLIFNDDRTGLCSGESFEVNGRPCRIFSSDESAQLWSLADMLRYVLAAHLPQGIEPLNLDELDALAGELQPPRVGLVGLSLKEALARLAGLGGLAIRAAAGSAGGRGLVFYRPGWGGRRLPLGLQPPGESLDLRRSNLWQGRFSLGAGGGGAMVLGAVRKHECTLELSPGWDVELESFCHRDFVRGAAGDWAPLGEVYRQWVLNEHGRYSGSPQNLPAFDFATIDADDFLLRVPRRLMDCLSRAASGESLGVIVEISCDDGETWQPYGGAVRLAPDECAVYLADDALPADYFQAAWRHEARLRVTATVASDRRVYAEVAAEAGRPTAYLEAAGCEWACVHPSSVFYQRQDLPAPLERDDSARLAALAVALAQAQTGTQAEVTLGWLDAQAGVGDLVEAVAGRGLALGAAAGRLPHVARVEHVCGAEWYTRLSIT